MYEQLIKAYAHNQLPVILFGEVVVGDKLLPKAPVNLLLKQFNNSY